MTVYRVKDSGILSANKADELCVNFLESLYDRMKKELLPVRIDVFPYNDKDILRYEAIITDKDTEKEIADYLVSVYPDGLMDIIDMDVLSGRHDKSGFDYRYHEDYQDACIGSCDTSSQSDYDDMVMSACGCIPFVVYVKPFWRSAMMRRLRGNSTFLHNRSRFEKKHRKFEGAGAGMLIQVENVDCSNSRLTEIKDNRDGTFSISLKNVILEGVSLNTYYWGTSYQLSKVKCDVVVEMEADYDTDVEKLRNRLAKMKSQPKAYGINTYSAELSFGTLSCGGGWSHTSLADGFDAEAYADELHEWRNMGNNGTVTLWWDAPKGQSVEDDMIITSIFVDAGSVLEDFYQDGEDEWLDESSEDDEDDEDEDDAYESVSRHRCSSESLSRKRRTGIRLVRRDRG